MPCKQQSDIPTVYQTHVFAKLHKQNENWLRLKILFGKQWSAKEWLQWQLFPSFWCYWRSSFRQVWEMHFWIMLSWIIWFDLWNQWANQRTNQLSNQPMIKWLMIKQQFQDWNGMLSFLISFHQNEESIVYRKSRMQSFQARLLSRLLNLLPTSLISLRKSMASTPLIRLRQSMVSTWMHHNLQLLRLLRETRFLREHEILHPCWLSGATWPPSRTSAAKVWLSF